jgi:hypothetical protein
MADGEQPGVPEDSDALPPQWRAPETDRTVEPAAERPAEPVLAEPQAQAEPDFPAYPAHEAVPQAAQAPEPEAQPVSSPVKVIEIGAAEESAAETAEPGASQGQRRGWWRRLIE